MKPKIKLIIIDLYGVMSVGSYKETCRWISRKYKIDFDICYDIVYHKYFTPASLGKITERQSFELAAKEIGMKEDWKIFRSKHLSFQHINKSVFNFAKSLQNKEYKILLLSKNTTGQFKYVVNKYQLKKHFDLINTYDLKLSKGSAKTFKYVLKKYKVKADEVFFVDDQYFNLPNAKKLGIHTYLYKNFKDFRKYLTSLLND
ncbi:HAD-IA family hydrolase [Patescibacteria group bacterium]|nr:HAD-IA family hydrolase [Patescibacteria group bacterium]